MPQQTDDQPKVLKSALESVALLAAGPSSTTEPHTASSSSIAAEREARSRGVDTDAIIEELGAPPQARITGIPVAGRRGLTSGNRTRLFAARLLGGSLVSGNQDRPYGRPRQRQERFHFRAGTIARIRELNLWHSGLSQQFALSRLYSVLALGARRSMVVSVVPHHAPHD